MLLDRQRVTGIARKLLYNRIIEHLGPVIGSVWLIPLEPPKVMNDIPAGEDHHAPLPQLRKPSREIQVVIQWAKRIDR